MIVMAMHYSPRIGDGDDALAFGPWPSVSVIDKQCALADAYATAFTVLGPDAGYQLALKQNLPVLFIIHTGPETFAEKTTPSFDGFVMK